MTALLVLESGTDLNASITIPDSLTPELQSIRANRGHTIGLQAGETVRRIDMMYAMLLPSANDAASVLANDTSGSLAAFAAQMNVRASQLGCTATHFTCPHGLYDGGNYSTARDMAKIALACYANSTYRRIADTASYLLPATELHPARTVTTTNKLLQPASGYYRSYAHGMKTGFTTQAGRCFVTFAQQDGTPTDWSSSGLELPEHLPGRRQSCLTGPLPAPSCTLPRWRPSRRNRSGADSGTNYLADV